MENDPVVEEIRKARENLAKECDYDIHKIADRMRKSQSEHPERIVTKDHVLARREKTAANF